MASRRYIPRCPTCRYDLTGLRDGACPECGNHYQHAALRAAWELAESRRPKRTGHETLYLAALLAAPPCCLIEYPFGLIATALMWPLAVVWCVQHWDRLRDERAYWMLWLLLACARTLVGLGPVPLAPVAACSALAALWVLYHAFRHTPAESGAALFGAAAVVLLPVGFLAAAQGGAGVASGHYWGAFDRPRHLPFMDLLGPSHVRAMTNAGMLKIGITALVAGAVAASVAALFARLVFKRLRAAER